MTIARGASIESLSALLYLRYGCTWYLDLTCEMENSSLVYLEDGYPLG